MNFYDKLNHQQNILTCHNYVNYIWDKIHNETDDNPENEEDSEHFYNHIPIQFNNFLAECNYLLLNSDITEVYLDQCDIKYLVALILTGLKEIDVSLEAESAPSQATVLYLSVAVMDNGHVFDADTLNYLLSYMLQFLQKRISYCYPISNFMFIALNKFFQETKHDILLLHLHQALYFLQNAITNTIVTIDNFNLDRDSYMLPNKAVFICIKTIIQKKRPEVQVKEIITRISILLIKHVNDNFNIKETVKHFFKQVLHKHVKYTWYIKLLTLLPEHILNDDNYFVYIINEIFITDKYYWIVLSILNHFIKDPKKYFDIYLNTLYSIIQFPHPDISSEIREIIIKKIIKQLVLKSADEDMNVKEKILTIFMKLFRLKDVYVKRYLQQMFHNDSSNKISAKVLFGIFESGLDIKWKQTTYNANFIKLSCEMFLKNKHFISAYRLKVVEILCSKATAFCLQSCIPSIVELIKRYAAENSPIIRPLLRILTENALKPTTAANTYIKEIFDLISDIMTPLIDCDQALAICNIIFTDDFDFVNLIRMFDVHNLIMQRHVQVLFEEKSLKKKLAVWQLLSLLLDLGYYVPFPPHIQYMILNNSSVDLYGKPESLYVIQVMGKVFSNELQNSSINEESKSFAVRVENIFGEHVKCRLVPMKHINTTIILLLTLQKITHSSTEWMKLLFYDSLDFVLDNIFLEINALIVQRNMTYISEIYTLMNFKIEESHMIRIKELSKCSNEHDINLSNGITWSLFITFYGRICLKNPDMISPSIPNFQFAILHGTPVVQQITLFALYDICTVRLNYYEAFEPVIMNLIQSEFVEVKSTTIKILVDLINNNHIRLDSADFILFMLVLLDRRLKLCLYYKDILEKDFFHRNENLISKYFIHLLLHLNNYKNHPEYSVTSDKLKSQEYTYERRSIVLKLLFGMLQRYHQFQILDVVNSEILCPIYTGEMAPTHNVLNIFRDILNIVLVTAMQYVNEDIVINEAFHEGLLKSIKKDFLSNSSFTNVPKLEFNNITKQVMLNLLSILHKIERFNKDLLPLLYNVIAIATKAHYERLQHILQYSTKLKDLYYELPKIYERYKEIIIAEPLNILTWEKEEWQMYLEYTD